MSRTHRRGRPSRNMAIYQRMGVVQDELSFEDKKSFQDHVDQAVRLFHSDKHNDRYRWKVGYWGIPRCIREVDRKRQARAYKAEIHRALRSVDQDVMVQPLLKFALWDYWMYW